jgi:hypothetical protein
MLFKVNGRRVFLDHNLKQYQLDGGIGGTTVRGTRARVWIMSFSKLGRQTWSRSIRFDLKTAREFHAAFGEAIVEAERQERLLNENAEAFHLATSVIDYVGDRPKELSDAEVAAKAWDETGGLR